MSFALSLGLGTSIVFGWLFGPKKKSSGMSYSQKLMEPVIEFTLGKLNYLVEANYFPDWLIRIGIRALLASRISELPTVDIDEQ